MATLKELLAAKQAQASEAKRPPKGGTTNEEDHELTEAIDRIDPPGKLRDKPTRAPSLVLSNAAEAQPAQAPLPESWQEGRSLGSTKGELVPMAWDYAISRLETDLCVIQCPDSPESCWLALLSTVGGVPPLLLHRLPWLLYPAKPTAPNEPF